MLCFPNIACLSSIIPSRRQNESPTDRRMRFGTSDNYKKFENRRPHRLTSTTSAITARVQGMLNSFGSSSATSSSPSAPPSFSTGGQPPLMTKIIAHKTLISRVIVCTAIVCVLWYALSSFSSSSSGSSTSSSAASSSNSAPVWDKAFPLARSDPVKSSFRVAIVADLDKKSKLPEKESKKPKWQSYLLEGELKRDGDKFEILWGQTVKMQSSFGEAGRGMELSELAVFEGRLWTFDDRSGLAFEITSDHQVIPRAILMEGDGNKGKGQKTEWATVKDGKLVVGSFGKEYVNAKNVTEITSTSNLWVSIIEPCGNSFVVSHEDWEDNYNALRDATNTRHPNYMIIEAIEWSDVHQRWIVLPRRVSEEIYDEEKDESRGSNKVLSASKDFSDVKVWEAGELIPTHGFSSFAFLPGSDDSIVVALKTEENEAEGTQTTHFMVFEFESGRVLLEETEIPGQRKYEGLTFV